MAISLGKDCALSWDGVAVPGVRDVTIDLQTHSIEVTPFGSRTVGTYQTGYSISLTVETIDDTAAAAAVTAAQSGAQITVAATGWSCYAVVTGVSDAQPLNDVRAWSVTMASTINGLR